MLQLYQVDAFVRRNARSFSGNPAAVVVLQHWLDDNLLQAIAAENNLSETAFILRDAQGVWQIRWFTPVAEVDLCGHATLASAHVISRHLGDPRELIPFSCGIGALAVRVLDGQRLQLDFPARPAERLDDPLLHKRVERALGCRVVALGASRDLLVELESEARVRGCAPNLALLADLDFFALTITARGSEFDFVSRFFAPRHGIDEDPVTGSAHCTLVPWWAAKLDRQELTAWQCSRRGGHLWLRQQGERVLIAGECFDYLQGRIQLPGSPVEH